jgi:transcriptional regulator with XRE-family HTH domain
MSTTMPLSKTFRDNLRAAMALRDITQQDLSKLSGIHYVTISRILSGSIEPTLDTCEKLAKAAKIEPEKIFEKSA